MDNIIRPQINSDDSSQAAPRWTQIKDVCNKNTCVVISVSSTAEPFHHPSRLESQKCDGERSGGQGWGGEGALQQS